MSSCACRLRLPVPSFSRAIVLLLAGVLAACSSTSDTSADAAADNRSVAARAGFVGQGLATALVFAAQTFAGPAAEELAALAKADNPGAHELALTDETLKALDARLRTTNKSDFCKVEVTREGVGRYRVDLRECSLTPDGGVPLAGVVVVELGVDAAARSVTATLTFESLKVGGMTLVGAISVAVQAAGAGDGLLLAYKTENLQLVTPDVTKAGVSCTGTLAVQPATGEGVVNGSGTVTFATTAYELLTSDVAVAAGDGMPHAGSVSVTDQRGVNGVPVTVQVYFLAETPATGKVEVIVDGKSLGTMSPLELARLFGGA